MIKPQHQGFFSPYQVDSLFLLVGRNPLPNYVAAKLLLKEGGRLYLVHSETTDLDTKPVAERLARMLGVNATMIPVDPLVPQKIYDKVKCHAKQATGKVGLNYTGGTKLMVTQAYRAVRKKHGDDAIYSYLNADTLQLIVEGEDELPTNLLAKLEDMSIETLMELHGGKLHAVLPDQPRLNGLSRALARLHSQGKASQWQGYLSQVRKKWADMNIEDIVASLNDWPFKGVGSHMDALWKEFDSVREQLEWLTHDWLADWTFLSLPDERVRARNIPLKELGIYGANIATAMMRGYQLFVFGCTLGSDADFKTQLAPTFAETFNYAQRLGGDEACVGLVCLAEDPDVVESDLRTRWETRNDRVRVFGQDKLFELDAEIKRWIDTL